MANIGKVHISWKEQMKSRLTSEFQISNSFGSSFFLEGLWMCVCVRAWVRVFYSSRISLFWVPDKSQHNFFWPRWLLVAFFLVIAWKIPLLTVPNMSFMNFVYVSSKVYQTIWVVTMPGNCCVFNCRSNYNNDTKGSVFFFLPPREKRLC